MYVNLGFFQFLILELIFYFILDVLLKKKGRIRASYFTSVPKQNHAISFIGLTTFRYPKHPFYRMKAKRGLIQMFHF